MNTLADVVKDKVSDGDFKVKLKIFPGLTVTSKFIPIQQSYSNLIKGNYVKSDYVLSLKADFSKDYKRKIKKSHIK